MLVRATFWSPFGEGAVVDGTGKSALQRRRLMQPFVSLFDIPVVRAYNPQEPSLPFRIMIARRSFLKQAGLTMAAVASTPAWLPGTARAQQAASNEHPEDTFHLAMAGYTFNKFKLDPSLEMLKKVPG